MTKPSTLSVPAAAIAISAATLLVLAACGSDVSSDDDDDDGSGASASGGNCPASPPADGSECEPSGAGAAVNTKTDCTWGDDPRPQCRTMGQCVAGGWNVTEPTAATCALDPLPAECDSSPPAEGSACSDTAVACWYPDGQRCWCSACQGGSGYPVCTPIDPPQWACSEPAAGCPATVPQAGTACSPDGASCGFGCEWPVVCVDGVWEWQHEDCPICAAPTSPVATPSGARPMVELRAGDRVYSVHDEAIVAVPLLRVASTPVANHQVMRVALASGAVLEISPGHPTADGRMFADLARGEQLDGKRIVAAELVPYGYARTYDILPDSDTGTYFVGGALIGSTLKR